MKVTEMAKLMYEVVEATKSVTKTQLNEHDYEMFLNTLEALRPKDKYTKAVHTALEETYVISDYGLDERLSFLAHPRAVMFAPSDEYVSKDVLMHEEATMAEVMDPAEFELFQHKLFNAYKASPNCVAVDSPVVGLDTVKVFTCEGRVHVCGSSDEDILPLNLTIAKDLFEDIAFDKVEAVYVRKVLMHRFKGLK